MEQTPGRSLFASAACTELTLLLRLEPGPMPLTVVRRSASWSSAPRTVTTKLAVALLAPRSVAVQVTEVSPVANRLPADGTHTALGAGRRSSVTVTVYETVVP